MIASIITKIFPNKATAPAAYKPNHIPFRVVFVSPFFELEVDPGNGWHTVHSQDASKLEDGSLVYPLLRFASFDDATDYATKNLRLTLMRERSMFGLFLAPPASYEKEAKPRIIKQENVVEGALTQKAHVPEAVPSFVLHAAAPAPKVWGAREPAVA
jgi:hypothetical protein